MDPISQVSIGAAAAALAARKGSTRRALLVGAVAGGLPDLDVFIRSDTDPLLALQYHRHFTHALLFAPVIGVVVAILFRLLTFKNPWPFRELLTYATLGALSHGLLDACTSYGTQLYLPFSTYRESWDIISIIDPLFTLPLIGCLLWALIRKRSRPAHIGLSLCIVYLSFGYIQRERAQHYAQTLATSRGYSVDELTARPSFANNILWRIIVRSGDTYHVDAVWLMPFKTPKLYPGSQVQRANLPAHSPAHGQQAQDIARFHHFSQGYLYAVPGQPNILGDLRYALFPNSIQPLWGIRTNPATPEQHVEMVYYREPSTAALKQLWTMLRGQALTPPTPEIAVN